MTPSTITTEYRQFISCTDSFSDWHRNISLLFSVLAYVVILGGHDTTKWEQFTCCRGRYLKSKECDYYSNITIITIPKAETCFYLDDSLILRRENRILGVI